MSRRRILILSVIAILVVPFLLGPRVPIDTAIHAVQLPEDLNAYLIESEAQFADIRPDTEKTIFWADPAQRDKTDVAVVYVHGFSSSRQEIAPVSDLVAADLTANLFYTRLTGHGRSDDAMAEASVNAWLNDAAEAVAIGEQLGDKLIVIAASTGATAVTYLASTGQIDDNSILVFSSPNDFASELLLWPWAKNLARFVLGRYRSSEPLNREYAMYWTYRYPVEALLPMMGTVKLVRKTNVNELTQPLLVLYSPLDSVVNPQKTEEFFAEFGSNQKKLVSIDTQDPGHHVLAGDVKSPAATEDVVSEILAFVEPLLDKP
ncbi:lysophospholipase [Chloroflexi bacterium TSY]|nr:lysophospholipase [Chloroflexi bacterium TSY]